MVRKQKTTDNINKDISWEVSEYEKHSRGKGWYIFSSIVSFLLILYSFLTGNFLFAIIIIIATIVVVLHDGQETTLVKISLTEEGVVVGRKFYDYDEFENFSIVYKPKQGIKNLYFEFKSVVRPRLSIPLEKINPLLVREKLLKYLEEDLDRTDQPLSEELAKLFKL